MNAYSGDYLKKWEIIDERYYTNRDPSAKQQRDRRARQLRKEGYIVECKIYHFHDMGGGSVYTLDAKRIKEG